MKYDFINRKDDTTTLLMQGVIGDHINAETFANTIVSEVNKGQKINLVVNSIGGSVIGGYSIMNALDYAAEKTQVETNVKGVAYSMAGVIVAACKGKRKMASHSTMMTHPARKNTKEPLNSAEIEVINKINNSLSDIISKNTKKSKAETDELLKNETYYNAEESLNLGLVDEITGTKREINAQLTDYELMVALSDNKEMFNTQIIKKMNIVNQMLNLNSEASVEAQAEAIKNLKAKTDGIVALENELQSEKRKNQSLVEKIENLEAEQIETKVKSLVNEAAEKGLIEKGKIDVWVAMAKKDYDGTQSLIETLTPKAVGEINNKLTGEGGKEVTQKDKSAKYSELLNKKDYAGLIALGEDYANAFDAENKLEAIR